MSRPARCESGAAARPIPPAASPRRPDFSDTAATPRLRLRAHRAQPTSAASGRRARAWRRAGRSSPSCYKRAASARRQSLRVACARLQSGVRSLAYMRGCKRVCERHEHERIVQYCCAHANGRRFIARIARIARIACIACIASRRIASPRIDVRRWTFASHPRSTSRNGCERRVHRNDHFASLLAEQLVQFERVRTPARALRIPRECTENPWNPAVRAGTGAMRRSRARNHVDTDRSACVCARRPTISGFSASGHAAQRRDAKLRDGFGKRFDNARQAASPCAAWLRRCAANGQKHGQFITFHACVVFFQTR